MDIPTALELAAQQLANLTSGPLAFDALRQRAHAIGLAHGQQWSVGSIMPYDFCHNHQNKGSRSPIHRFLRRVGRGLYEYVGPTPTPVQQI